MHLRFGEGDCSLDLPERLQDCSVHLRVRHAGQSRAQGRIVRAVAAVVPVVETVTAEQGRSEQQADPTAKAALITARCQERRSFYASHIVTLNFRVILSVISALHFNYVSSSRIDPTT